MLFTPQLYYHLISEGYTHIYYQGLQNKTTKDDPLEHDDYILVPCKEDFTLTFEEANAIVEKIDSLDVKEMLEFTPGIDFWIEAPEDLILKWQQQIKN